MADMTMRCKFDGCGETIVGTVADITKHYREAHPGERSPGSRPRNKPPTDTAPPPPPPGPADQLDLDPAGAETRPDLGPDAVDPAPVEPARRSWRDRLWGAGARDVSRGTSTREPKAKVKRTNTADILSGGWGLLGLGMVRSGADVPVGRCLQYQAPIAGDVLDKVLAGSLFDRAVLQPIARHTDEAEVLAALVGLPVLIFAWERATDELRAVLEPLMAEAIRAHLAAMGPVMKKKAARDRELAKVVDDLRADGQLPPEANTVDDAVQAVFASIFAPRDAAQPDPNAREAATV